MATRGATRSFGRKLAADGSTNTAMTPATAAMMPDTRNASPSPLARLAVEADAPVPMAPVAR
jgi:hypothetical protein